MRVESAEYAQKVQEWAARPYWVKELQALLSLVDLKGARVLDVGCGNCQAHQYVMEAGADSYFGLDVNPHLLQQRPPSVDANLYDGDTFPVFKKSVDVVLMMQSLPHMDNPRKIINESFRVLKPNGALVVSVTNAAHRNLKDQFTTFQHDPTIKSRFDEGKLDYFVRRPYTTVDIVHWGPRAFYIGPKLRLHAVVST